MLAVSRVLLKTHCAVHCVPVLTVRCVRVRLDANFGRSLRFLEVPSALAILRLAYGPGKVRTPDNDSARSHVHLLFDMFKIGIGPSSSHNGGADVEPRGGSRWRSRRDSRASRA